MYTHTDDACVLDGDGFIVARFPSKNDARVCAVEANSQINRGEPRQEVERRLGDWAHDLAMEDFAADEEAARYSD